MWSRVTKAHDVIQTLSFLSKLNCQCINYPKVTTTTSGHCFNSSHLSFTSFWDNLILLHPSLLWPHRCKHEPHPFLPPSCFNTANVCESHKHVCKSKNSAAEYFLYSICKLYFCIFNQHFEENIKNAKMLFFLLLILCYIH